ncbi:hypothetical protein RRF57_001682 [Xylaria bambusicola]|uniref:Uncharacterized protein n=1 Tax=Xylaria bambusicola TaxID=326684 RepID=A0AAN7UHL5_9PEZI
MAKYPEVGTSGEPRHDADDDDDDETISLCGYKMDWPSPGVSPAVPENPPDESQGEVGKECGMEIGDPL